MDCKRSELISNLKSVVQDAFWAELLRSREMDACGLHLAIFREPYLKFILEGKKTVESRFARRACPPFRKINKGDVIMLKRSPGDIVGLCIVESVWFYELEQGALDEIRRRFGKAICPEDGDFWNERRDCSVATLVLLKHIAKIKPVKIEKRDRRGWVVYGAK